MTAALRPNATDPVDVGFRAVMKEGLTSGPRLTPDRFDAHGRQVQGLFRDAPPVRGISPVQRSARYADPRVGEGVLRAIREAIGNHARFAALCERRGADVQELLRPGHERMVQNTRDWIAGDLDAMHPGFRESGPGMRAIHRRPAGAHSCAGFFGPGVSGGRPEIGELLTEHELLG